MTGNRPTRAARIVRTLMATGATLAGTAAAWLAYRHIHNLANNPGAGAFVALAVEGLTVALAVVAAARGASR